MLLQKIDIFMTKEVLLYGIAERLLHYCAPKLPPSLPLDETTPLSTLLIGYSLNMIALLRSERSAVLLQAGAKREMVKGK
jgi:hypothetical protein